MGRVSVIVCGYVMHVCVRVCVSCVGTERGEERRPVRHTDSGAAQIHHTSPSNAKRAHEVYADYLHFFFYGSEQNHLSPVTSLFGLPVRADE